jgi:hypothetical protein
LYGEGPPTALFRMTCNPIVAVPLGLLMVCLLVIEEERMETYDPKTATTKVRHAVMDYSAHILHARKSGTVATSEVPYRKRLEALWLPEPYIQSALRYAERIANRLDEHPAEQ